MAWTREYGAGWNRGWDKRWILRFACGVAVWALAVDTVIAGSEYPRAGWRAELSTIFHDVDGMVTLVDERTLQVDHFTFDGGGPAVYFYLGETDSGAAFEAGIPIGGQLSRAYDGESLTLTLPAGQSLDGYGAISVWCVDFRVNFGSGSFRPPNDLDENGVIDLDDYVGFADCMAGPDLEPDPFDLTLDECFAVYDLNVDRRVDHRDAAGFQQAFTVPQPESALYELVFDAVWSEETHPDSFPPSPHFSGLIGGTHNAAVSFWEVGELASPGMESMSETGSKTQLRNEVQAAIADGDAGAVISGGSISHSPGSVSVQFTVTQEFPRVTVVSMIAPSPDWFIGTTGYPLFQDGRWVEEAVVALPPFDTGTDSGTSYTSPDHDTQPPEPIFEITGPPFEVDGEVPPLGTFTFRRLE
jgi:hypothetical protein